MDLSLEDFNRAFLNSEVKKVSLKTMNGGHIYLRSLGRADMTRFQVLAEELQARLGVNIFAAPELADRVKDNDLADANDYIVFKALCDRNGDLLHKDLSSYIEWCKTVQNVVIDEIIHHINENMIVFFDPEEYEKESKKNKT